MNFQSWIAVKNSALSNGFLSDIWLVENDRTSPCWPISHSADAVWFAARQNSFSPARGAFSWGQFIIWRSILMIMKCNVNLFLCCVNEKYFSGHVCFPGIKESTFSSVLLTSPLTPRICNGDSTGGLQILHSVPHLKKMDLETQSSRFWD